MAEDIMKLSIDAEHVAFEISIKSLLCLFSTSNIFKVTQILLKRKLELQLFFRSDFNNTALINTLKSLVNVYNLPNELNRSRSEILSTTHCEEFLDCIKQYLLEMSKITKSKDTEFLETINYIVWFIDVNVNELPVSTIHYNRFWDLLKTLHDTLMKCGFQNETVVLWTNELMSLVAEKIIYIDRIDHVWKSINLYPSQVDIFEHKDLTLNQRVGPYNSEYLDIHFKLLKEDFESNLREGLLQYKAEVRGAPARDNTSIFIYNQVRVESLEIDRNAKNGILHKITFVIKEQRNDIIRFFLPGTILLFSEHSQFSTFVLAIVVEVIELPEEQRNLSKALKVSVIENPSRLIVGHTYTVVEPKTFFDPYHQVLKVIKYSEINFPMVKYIVHLDNKPSWPKYSNIHTEYNVAGRNLKLFGIHKLLHDLLNLNVQQVEVLQTALTHEFVLIQGPPGSGKTFLAQNIIKILIDSKILSSPILLISSKNDYVDRILEPLANSGRKVIRLGGQSKSAVLKKCTIFNTVKREGAEELKDRVNNIKEIIERKIKANEKIEDELRSFLSEQKSFIEVCEREDACQILAANVQIIGGTTVGCARLRCMLDHLQPEVVIVENANEVLESHVVASLSKGCKHIIMFGDHKQLQPKVANKNSSNKYNLDVSLFERMVGNGMKCCTLTEQRRMRPEIAFILSPAIYPVLTNHPKMTGLPNIKGMNKNLFFIDHEEDEEKLNSQAFPNYRNKYEGDIMLALAVYLIKQGYSTREITILTPYTYQQNYMRRAAKSIYCLQNIEIQMIDSYSGQENMIILLSFVCSQSPLSNNEINVALSRAKCGLYIIGNMKALINSSDLWSSLNNVLKQQNAIDKNIELVCYNHQTITAVTNKEDFKKVKDGGCNTPCKVKLKCGHTCNLLCHPSANKHHSNSCREPCARSQR